jgi:hypothetical protein
VDLPERQQTLRATVDWSVGLLDDDERSLLETVTVFINGWTVDAAAHVAGLDEDRVLALLEVLARHSLIGLHDTPGAPRCRMLDTIRAFVDERLAGRADADEVRQRHAEYYGALAERGDRPLRGSGQSRWADELQCEAGNLTAAMEVAPRPRARTPAAPVPGAVALPAPVTAVGSGRPPGRGQDVGGPAPPDLRRPSTRGAGGTAVDLDDDRHRGGRRAGSPAAAARLEPLLDLGALFLAVVLAG